MGLARIVTMLPVRSVGRAVEFYGKLGFEVERRNDGWGWAMLRSGDCRLMVDQSINGCGEAPCQTVVYLYAADVRAFHREARANGLTVPDLDETFYGMTEFRMKDPDGNPLWIGQMPG